MSDILDRILEAIPKPDTEPPKDGKEQPEAKKGGMTYSADFERTYGKKA